MISIERGETIELKSLHISFKLTYILLQYLNYMAFHFVKAGEHSFAENSRQNYGI